MGGWGVSYPHFFWIFIFFFIFTRPLSVLLRSYYRNSQEGCRTEMESAENQIGLMASCSHGITVDNVETIACHLL